MLAESYKIRKKIVDGASILGYVLEASDGQTMKVDKNTVNRLALNNQIEGCRAQKYNGNIVLKGVTFSLRDIPRINLRDKDNKPVISKWEVTKRIIDGNRVVGYFIQRDNNIKSVTKNELIQLIVKEDNIKNARVQKNNGKFILRGMNCNLSDLPMVSVELVRKRRA